METLGSMSEGTKPLLAHITVNGSEKSNEIFLGPVLWYWPKETLEDFYQQAPPAAPT